MNVVKRKTKCNDCGEEIRHGGSICEQCFHENYAGDAFDLAYQEMNVVPRINEPMTAKKASQDQDSILLYDTFLTLPGCTLLDACILSTLAAEQTGTNKSIGKRLNIHHRDVANRLRSLQRRELITDITSDRMEKERVFRLSKKSNN